jgi:hypothetical protein
MKSCDLLASRSSLMAPTTRCCCRQHLKEARHLAQQCAHLIVAFSFSWLFPSLQSYLLFRLAPSQTLCIIEPECRACSRTCRLQNMLQHSWWLSLSHHLNNWLLSTSKQDKEVHHSHGQAGGCGQQQDSDYPGQICACLHCKLAGKGKQPSRVYDL